MNNINSFRRFKFIRQFHPINFSKEVHKFSELTTELVFLVRALFFILFGYLINVSEIINQATLPWAVCISVAIFIVRYIFLKVFKLTINPLFFFAPRGLITILLFMSIPAGQKISIVNNSLIIQVIIFTAIIMMVGLMYYKPEKEPKVITQESH
jgi:NhaP-type Na+/H+ or K+/H+ antiporter